METKDFSGYSKLSTEEEDHLLETSGSRKIGSYWKHWKQYGGIMVLLLALTISVSFNVSLLIQRHGSDGSSYGSCLSTYAKLANDTVSRTIHPHEEYVGEANLTATWLAWEKLSGDTGVVALSDEYVAATNLPTGIRWPWDTSKGVYLLQGHHNLHCLRIVARSLMEYHLGVPQKSAFVHVLHCLDELRQDVICKADDTPRYASNHPPGTGLGQVRTCRDWNALENWAREHTACFRHEDGVPERMVNRFMRCPDGSQPWLDREIP